MKRALRINFRRMRNYIRTTRSTSTLILRDADYDLGAYYISMLESLDHPVTVTFSSRRIDPSLQRKMIKKIIAERKTELQTTINPKTGGKSTIRKQVEDAETILNELDAENSKLFDVSLCIKVSSDHPVDLKDRVERLSGMLSHMGMETENDPNWLSSKPLKPTQRLSGKKYLLDSRSLVQIIPLYFTPKTANEGVLIGVDDLNEKPVYLDPFSGNSHNMLIIGETGSGKSFFIKLMIHRLLKNKVCQRIFIFDPLNEYHASIFSEPASFIDLHDDGSMNFQNGSGEFADNELTRHVCENGHIVVVRPSFAGNFSEKAIESITRAANSFMSYGSERKMLIFDECHIITSTPSGFQALNSMVRHSRHFNASVVNLSQNVDDFLRSELASIAYNSNRIFIFRTRSLRDEHKPVLKLEDFDFSPPESLLGGRTDSFSECIVSTGKIARKLRVLSTSDEIKDLSA